MQRAVGTVLVSLLVVLAGCSGVLGGSEESTETLTPAAVPTDEPTPTPVPKLAPGVTEQGIDNASALVAAHTSLLGNQSFSSRSNTTALAQNGSVLARYTSTLRAGAAGEGVYSVSERNGSYGYQDFEFPVHTEVWSNGEQLFLNETYTNGTAIYDRQRVDIEERYGAVGAGLRYRLEPFGTANTSVTEQFTRNGTTLYRVRGTARNTEQGNVNLRLLVDSRGVIHTYRTVRQQPLVQNISRVVYEIRFSEIGATDAPERPSWVDAAMNRTTETP